MGATAHSMAFDTGRASPFFAINDRHSGVIDGRLRSWSWLEIAAQRWSKGYEHQTGTNQKPTASQETLLVVGKVTGQKSSIEEQSNQ